jgi:hypothetical protein
LDRDGPLRKRARGRTGMARHVRTAPCERGSRDRCSRCRRVCAGAATVVWLRRLGSQREGRDRAEVKAVRLAAFAFGLRVVRDLHSLSDDGLCGRVSNVPSNNLEIRTL